jgi:DNA polymerase zeta
MPLIMEPLSTFYKGPLVVLDFQSLYPSIMILYNHRYSTCLGRI